MPDQALFGIPGHNTVDDHICAFKLLIAADDFVLAILFVRCKHGEELEDIHNLLRGNHILNADLHISKATFGFVGCRMPRAPHINRHVNGAVSIALSFGCKVEYIRYEHSRDAFLVSGDVTGSVQPCNCAANGSLKLTNSNRETVDKENNIESLSTFGLRVYPLICDDVFVQSKVLFTHCSEETNRYHAAILAEGIGVFLKDHLLENLVLGDKVVRLNGEDNGSQFIYDLIGTRRVLCDFGV